MTIEIKYNPALKSWSAIQTQKKEMPLMSSYNNISGTCFRIVRTFIACGDTRQEVINKAIERTFHKPIRA